MSIALIPGTFDPLTLGHLDVIVRAAKVCKKLMIGVASNVGKRKCAFSADERVELVKKCVQEHKNIEVVLVDGLIVDFAQHHQVEFLIRGLRAFSDMESEFQMALANQKIGGIETLFFTAGGEYAHISSTLIREVAACGHHLKDFVPAPIEEQVLARLSARHRDRSSTR